MKEKTRSHHHGSSEEAPGGHDHAAHGGEAAGKGRASKGHHDHEAHHRGMIEDFRRRFFISLALTPFVLVLSPMIGNFLGISMTFPGSTAVLLLLSSFVFLYGGWPFLNGFAGEVKKGAPGMMTLIALAISVAYFYSAAVVFGLPGKIFFWELVTLVDIMLLGHWIEMRSVLGASRALQELARLMPSEAHVLRNGDVVEVSLAELSPGDMVLVRPGEKVPADSVVVRGQSYVNEALITGESKPVRKKEGDALIGGALNGEGSLEARIEKTGEDSYLSKIVSLVRQAQDSKSKTQHLADRAALWLTLVAIGAGTATLAAWLFIGRDFAYAMERMVTVMVITCPHALGLAIPLVVAVSTALCAANGLLIRNRTAFENARKITAVVFDKTGTLTEGTFGVTGVRSLDETVDEREILTLAASLERNSEHPIASGILREAEEKGANRESVNDFEALKGKGIMGAIGGKRIGVVSPGYLREKGIATPGQEGEDGASTVVYVLREGDPVGEIRLADRVRKESRDAVKRLQTSGIRCLMLTGDNRTVAEAISRELGLDGTFAEVLPHEKQEKIKALQSQGEFVAMTGDGVNDAPALAQADVGIAVGSGTDVAAETADIVLVNSNPGDVASLVLFGRATYRKMVQNLWWATGYNVIAIPLAAGVFYKAGLVISPAVGAILMSLSTVIVAVNARMLRFGEKN